MPSRGRKANPGHGREDVEGGRAYQVACGHAEEPVKGPG